MARTPDVEVDAATAPPASEGPGPAVRLSLPAIFVPVPDETRYEHER